MAQPYEFPGKKVLVDVTITKVTAGGTHNAAVSGSVSNATGASTVTQIGSAGSILSSAMSGLYGDLTDLIVIPPVDAAGDYPDVAIWPIVDGVSLADKVMIDGSFPGNTFPNPGATVGGIRRSLGVPVRDALRKNRSNFAIVATGLKATRQYQFAVSSDKGWGNSAAAQTPLRIIGLGDQLDGTALDAVAAQIGAQGYPGGINLSVAPYRGLQATHMLKGGALSPATWTGLPGGTNQSGVKVFRFERYAYNAIATPATGNFILSNQNAVQGAEGNVVDANHDLGFDFSINGEFLQVMWYGARPGANNAFIGFRVDDTVLPDANGAFATAGVNPYAYGSAYPQRNAAEFYALPKAPWPMVAYRNRLSFFVAADGTAVAANADSVAIGGLLVQPGQA